MERGRLGIRGQMVLYAVVPTVLILGVVIALAFTQRYYMLMGAAEREVLDLALLTAQEIEAGNREAVRVAQTMALTQQPGVLWGRRQASLAYARDVLASYPQFYGAYFGYEPNADGQDAAFAPASQPAGALEAGSQPAGSQPVVVGALDPLALSPQGRFIPYWFRNRQAGGTLALTPLTLMDGLYYEGCRQRWLDPRFRDKAMVTEPYDYEGAMIVEQTYPIVHDGQFMGVAGVDRTLDHVEALLQSVKRGQRDRGRRVDVVLISRKGKVVAETFDKLRLEAQEVSATSYARVYQAVHTDEASGTLVRMADPAEPADNDAKEVRDDLDGQDCFFVAATIPTGDWTLILRVPVSDYTTSIVHALVVAGGVTGTGVLVVVWLLLWNARRLTARIGQAVDAAQRVAGGDLTGDLQVTGADETAVLVRALATMTASLHSLVQQVKQSSIQLASTAMQLNASSRHQEGAIVSLGSSTAEVAAATKEISATSQELLGTMDNVTRVASEAADVAVEGRSSLGGLDATMRQLAAATTAISDKLGEISQRASDITGVVTTITKVAEQTNVLSINAAIEAEKAGEAGMGFLVVAREIRRLADQTAVATLDIERLVRQMQSSVSSGVMAMERFTKDVAGGVDKVRTTGAQFGQIIEQVQGLTGRFAQVNDAMRAQAAGAGQISEAMVQINSSAQATAQTLKEFNSAADHLYAAINALKQEVSRFTLRDR